MSQVVDVPDDSSVVFFDEGLEGIDRLCKILYGRTDFTKTVGGSDAQVFHDAAERIAGLEDQTAGKITADTIERATASQRHMLTDMVISRFAEGGKIRPTKCDCGDYLFPEGVYYDPPEYSFTDVTPLSSSHQEIIRDDGGHRITVVLRCKKCFSEIKHVYEVTASVVNRAGGAPALEKAVEALKDYAYIR